MSYILHVKGGHLKINRRNSCYPSVRTLVHLPYILILWIKFQFFLNYQTNKDECLSNPCMNNGKCIQSPGVPNDYKCECPPEFTGKNCQTDRSALKVQYCTKYGCKNNSTCRVMTKAKTFLIFFKNEKIFLYPKFF